MIRVSAQQFAVLAIAAIFVARAALRLAQPEFNVLRFAVLGWAPWAVWAVSAAEIVGAALLMRAATFHLGALALAGVAGLFVVTYMRMGVPEAGLGAAGLLAALAGLALLRHHPRHA